MKDFAMKTLAVRNLAVAKINAAADAALSRFGHSPLECPVCKTTSTLSPQIVPTGIRPLARCTSCQALERHRLLAYTLTSRVFPAFAGAQPRILHFAPEPGITNLLRGLHPATYVTTDLETPGVDVHASATDLPFASESFDIVIASHVLEHIPNDRAAIAEIRRVLSPNGLAVLPVPVVNQTTTEYDEPNPYEALHVRAPGPDYYDRLSDHFTKVDIISSLDAPREIQPFIFEDRSHWPSEHYPLRQPAPGFIHLDYVPLAWC